MLCWEENPTGAACHGTFGNFFIVCVVLTMIIVLPESVRTIVVHRPAHASAALGRRTPLFTPSAGRR